MSKHQLGVGVARFAIECIDSLYIDGTTANELEGLAAVRWGNVVMIPAFVG